MISESLVKYFISFVLLASSLNCDKIQFGSPGMKLKQVESYSIKVPEPSGLSLSADKKYLWTVSDRNSSVYLLTLQGEVLKKFKVDANDLEGITVVDENTLAVLSEETSEIVFVDTSGNLINRKKIKAADRNFSNLEGLAYDNVKNRFFAVNKVSPPVLIEFDFDMNEIVYTRKDFFKDLSGVSYCPEGNILWILSDGDKSIVKYKLGESLEDGEFIELYKTNIRQAEGIAVDCENNKIYLVSDHEEKLYIFDIE